MSTVRQHFAAAAATYNAYSPVQREIAAYCARMAAAVLPPHARTLDIGAGTGHVAAQLQPLRPDVALTALDIALPMCRAATGYRNLICADMAHMPLRDACMDGIVSSLALQWAQPDQVFSECARILKPGGSAVIATLGPHTLQEMAASFRSIHGETHAHVFPNSALLLSAAEQASLQAQCTEEALLWHYPDLFALMHALKAIGATYRAPVRHGLTTRVFFQQADDYYQRRFRDAAGIRATWQVYYLHLQKIQHA